MRTGTGTARMQADEREDQPLTAGTAPDQRLSANGALSDLASPPPGGSSGEFIAFTTPQVGYAEVGGALYRTDDGGDTWRQLQIS